MAGVFAAACREYEARPAYRVGGDWITYAECHRRVAQIAASLDESLSECRRSTGQQARIAVMLPNSAHVLELYFVAALTDSIVLPLDHRLSRSAIETRLRANGASVLVTSDDLCATLTRIRWESVPVRTIIWTGTGGDLSVEDHRTWGSLLAAEPSVGRPSRPAPTSFLQGFATPTGRAETVLHTHHDVLDQSVATIEALALSSQPDQCWGHVGPMSNVGAAAFAWIGLLLGARHVFHEQQHDVVGVAARLAGERVTMVTLPPSVLRMLCASDSIGALRFPDLRGILVDGAAPDQELLVRAAGAFDCDLIVPIGVLDAGRVRSGQSQRAARTLAPTPGHPIRTMTDRTYRP